MIPINSNIIEACAFRFAHDRAEYLLLQRAQEEPVHPGMWQIITGRMAEGELPIPAALRELREETGLAPVHFWALPHLTSFFDIRKQEIYLAPVFAAQVSASDEVALSEEHMAFLWLPPREALRRLVWPSQRQALELVEQYIIGGEEAATRMEIGIP